jgi:hypothetical protein
MPGLIVPETEIQQIEIVKRQKNSTPVVLISCRMELFFDLRQHFFKT